MSFCTAINCMDGRVQLPVNRYLQQRFACRYVDTITEPGPVGIIVSQRPVEIFANIRKRIAISIDAHGSSVLAIAAHADCAGNPVSDSEQKSQLQEAVNILIQMFPGIEISGVWVREDGSVEEIASSPLYA